LCVALCINSLEKTANESKDDPEDSEFERELLKGLLAANLEMANEYLRPTPEVGEAGPSKWHRAVNVVDSVSKHMRMREFILIDIG